MPRLFKAARYMLQFLIHQCLHAQVPRDHYRELTKTAAATSLNGLFEASSLPLRSSSPFYEYFSLYGPCHVVPEGGSNLLGVCGCSETLFTEDEWCHDIAAVACGTGATLAGLAAGAAPGAKHRSVLYGPGSCQDYLFRWLQLQLPPPLRSDS